MQFAIIANVFSFCIAYENYECKSVRVNEMKNLKKRYFLANILKTLNNHTKTHTHTHIHIWQYSSFSHSITEGLLGIFVHKCLKPKWDFSKLFFFLALLQIETLSWKNVSGKCDYYRFYIYIKYICMYVCLGVCVFVFACVCVAVYITLSVLVYICLRVCLWGGCERMVVIIFGNRFSEQSSNHGPGCLRFNRRLWTYERRPFIFPLVRSK